MELTANVHLEDGSYWADIAELPGCFGSGDTLDELFGSLLEGIELYLDEDGKPAADSRRGSLRVKSAVLSDTGPA